MEEIVNAEDLIDKTWEEARQIVELRGLVTEEQLEEFYIDNHHRTLCLMFKLAQDIFKKRSNEDKYYTWHKAFKGIVISSYCRFLLSEEEVVRKFPYNYAGSGYDKENKDPNFITTSFQRDMQIVTSHIENYMKIQLAKWEPLIFIDVGNLLKITNIKINYQ